MTNINQSDDWIARHSRYTLEEHFGQLTDAGNKSPSPAKPKKQKAKKTCK